MFSLTPGFPDLHPENSAPLFAREGQSYPDEAE